MNTLLKFCRQACALLLLMTPGLAAQTSDTSITVPQTAMDSAFARARQLVISGQTAAGRQIADSILAATPTASPAYGNALYGRAQLAPTAVDAERIYQRIIVEYPLSTHAGDALLQLAQMERSQGDRGSAINHLRRYLSENPTNPKRVRTGFWLAQLLFEQNDDVIACGVLRAAQAAADPGDIELQNQMSFYTARCAAAGARASTDPVAHADSVRAPASTTKAPPTPKTTRAVSGSGYSVQIGAYGTAIEAQKAIARLHARGVEARVDGDRKPFRVWIGRFTTRAAATKALGDFKKVGIDGFVTSTGGR